MKNIKNTRIQYDLKKIIEDTKEAPEEFSRNTGIPYDHLMQLLSGEKELLAKDLFLIVKHTGLPADQIVNVIQQ